MDSKQNRITLPNAFADVQLLASLLDEVEDGIYIVDCERRVQYWNHGAEEITGYLAQDVVGRHCHQDLLMHCTAEGSVLCGGECPLLGAIEDGSRRECLVLCGTAMGIAFPFASVHVPSGIHRGPLLAPWSCLRKRYQQKSRSLRYTAAPWNQAVPRIASTARCSSAMHLLR